MEATLEHSEAAILSRIIRPEAGGWPRAAAEAILGIHFDPQDQQRMIFLLEKAKAGALSEPEAEEIENYRHIGRLLEIIKSRARNSLRTSGAG
jgi:hypothetical protein